MGFDFEEYQQQLSDKHFERSSDRKEMQRIVARTDLSLKRFNGDSVPSMINFADLDKFKINEWYFVNSKVKIKKVKSEERILIFETEMIEGGEFGWHLHEDCNEVCQILRGTLYDSHTDKQYNVNSNFYVRANVEHHPVALEFTKLLVIFDKV